MGTSDAAGKVVFSTYGSQEGAPLGTYKAVVAKLVPTKKAAARLEEIRARQPAVNEDGTEPMMDTRDYDFENLLPAKYGGIGTTDLAVTIDSKMCEIALKLVSEVPSR